MRVFMSAGACKVEGHCHHIPRTSRPISVFNPRILRWARTSRFAWCAFENRPSDRSVHPFMRIRLFDFRAIQASMPTDPNRNAASQLGNKNTRRGWGLRSWRWWELPSSWALIVVRGGLRVKGWVSLVSEYRPLGKHPESDPMSGGIAPSSVGHWTWPWWART